MCNEAYRLLAFYKAALFNAPSTIGNYYTSLGSAGTYDRGSYKTDRRFLCPFMGQAAFAAERSFMEFFNSAIDVLQTLVIALGAGLGIWGVINLLEGYGNDNPGAKSQGIKQLMAGGGVALIGTILVPLLSGLFG